MPGDLGTFIGVLAVLLASLWGTLWWWSTRGTRWLNRRPPRRGKAPLPLWRRLCEAHHLSAVEVQRLQALAHECQIGEPLLLFVDPRWLEQSLAGGAADAAILAELGRKLFGEEFHAAAP
jgi:hypothetical protein